MMHKKIPLDNVKENIQMIRKFKTTMKMKKNKNRMNYKANKKMKKKRLHCL